MASVHSKDTRPEIDFRKYLWSKGIRNYRKHPKLPGRPDLVFPKAKLVVFIDGCFWHGCPKHLRMPKSNVEYWQSKIQGNIERDKAVTKRLRTTGYQVLRIWEHEIKEHPERAATKIERKLTA